MNLLYLSALLSTLPLLSFSAPTPAPIQIPHHPLLRRDDAKIDTNTPLYSLPKLPFKLEGLEPVISKALVDLHYNKHHQAYVTALNGLLAAPANLSTQLANNENIRFNGGGHINHSLFWGNLAPPNSTETKYPAAEEMISDKVRVKWKTWDGLKKAVVDAGLSVKGSGWVWLVMDGSPGGEGSLQVVTRPNQDTILEPLVPILGIDVWEHSYYLQYTNNRKEYLEKVWGILNWKEAVRRYRDPKNVVQWKDWKFTPGSGKEN